MPGETADEWDENPLPCRSILRVVGPVKSMTSRLGERQRLSYPPCLGVPPGNEHGAKFDSADVPDPAARSRGIADRLAGAIPGMLLP